jgi:hypothetical protein
MHVIPGDRALQNLAVVRATDLANHIPQSNTDWSSQHALSRLRCPHEVVLDIEARMGRSPIAFHRLILTSNRKNPRVSPDGERVGFGTQKVK